MITFPPSVSAVSPLALMTTLSPSASWKMRDAGAMRDSSASIFIVAMNGAGVGCQHPKGCVELPADDFGIKRNRVAEGLGDDWRFLCFREAAPFMNLA